VTFGANPAKLAEAPAFAPNDAETKPYSLEEIVVMLNVLSEPSATAAATADFTGLCPGELRGLTRESYDPARDEESLGWLNVIDLTGAALSVILKLRNRRRPFP
jgi:hypothetical protein